jgi:hypothetical protein
MINLLEITAVAIAKSNAARLWCQNQPDVIIDAAPESTD